MKSKFISISIAAVLLFITSLNIGAYQATPPLLNNITNRNAVKDALIFVKKLAYSPYYQDQITYFSNYYGQSFKDAYEKDQNTYSVKKEALKISLLKNPNAPPLLTSLYILSYKTGNKKEARTYYEKAKKLDPNLILLQFQDIR